MHGSYLTPRGPAGDNTLLGVFYKLVRDFELGKHNNIYVCLTQNLCINYFVPAYAHGSKLKITYIHTVR